MMKSTADNYEMVKNSLAAVSAYQAHQRVNEDTPVKYESKNLFNVRELKQFNKDINIEDHENRFKKLKAEYEERQRKRKKILELEN